MEKVRIFGEIMGKSGKVRALGVSKELSEHLRQETGKVRVGVGEKC
jgi:hypothetical protein